MLPLVARPARRLDRLVARLDGLGVEVELALDERNSLYVLTGAFVGSTSFTQFMSSSVTFFFSSVTFLFASLSSALSNLCCVP